MIVDLTSREDGSDDYLAEGLYNLQPDNMFRLWLVIALVPICIAVSIWLSSIYLAFIKIADWSIQYSTLDIGLLLFTVVSVILLGILTIEVINYPILGSPVLRRMCFNIALEVLFIREGSVRAAPATVHSIEVSISSGSNLNTAEETTHQSD